MYTYHVTFLHRLPSVAALGLVPGAGENFGAGYAAHSRGKLFLAHPDGVSFWAARYEQIAHDQTDHPEDGWVPVVISVRLSDAEFGVLEDDELGTRDATAPSWWTTSKLATERLTVWDGTKWLDVAEVDALKVQGMVEEMRDAGEEIFEDDEHWWELDFDVFLPPSDELVLDDG